MHFCHSDEGALIKLMEGRTVEEAGEKNTERVTRHRCHYFFLFLHGIIPPQEEEEEGGSGILFPSPPPIGVKTR